MTSTDVFKDHMPYCALVMWGGGCTCKQVEVRKHYPKCPRHGDPGAICTCDELLKQAMEWVGGEKPVEADPIYGAVGAWDGYVYAGDSVDALLDTREKTHGDFSEVASVAQTLKYAFTASPNWQALVPAQKEALDLITTKLARILCGNPNEIDHWKDGAGYFTLGEKACKR